MQCLHGILTGANLPWIRSGRCTRCGQCCQGTPPPGISTLVDTHPPAVAGYCPLFEWRAGNAEGPGFCIGHTGAVPEGKEDSFYMAGCNVWPDHPDCIKDFDQCTYTFTEVPD